MSNDEWRRIRAEYVAGGTSYRKLAAKYGITKSMVEKRAKAEGWVETQRQTADRTEAKVRKRMVERISERQAVVDTGIFDMADLLLDKMRETVSMMDTLDPASMRSLTGALKDLAGIKGCKSTIDLEEQRARIEKLRREAAERQQADAVITVELPQELEEDA